MTTSLFLVLAIFLVGAQAGPWSSGLPPKCSNECAVAGNSKFAYQPHKTYTYDYSGQSHINLEGVRDASLPMEWSARVDVTWINPCDMVIHVKEPKILGSSSNPALEGLLAKYPLVVSMVEGEVKGVCAHPQDEPSGVNMKKGIASTLQNTLPTLSPIHDEEVFVETDVSGNCPTQYKVRGEPSHMTVSKFKDHKKCQRRFSSPNESPIISLFIKSPLPLQESWSQCEQEIKNGIIDEVKCQDTNIVRPSVGSYKYVVAKQVSHMKFVSEGSRNDIQSMGLPMRSYRHTNLTFDYSSPPKSEKVLPEIEKHLKSVCQKTERNIEQDAASHMAQAISYLRRAPDEKIKEILNNIRGGHFCQNYRKLENLYLDAVAFIGQAGAVEVMVEELSREEVPGGRKPLYIAALHLMARPSLKAVEAVTPLFDARRHSPNVVLAAGSVLSTYCRHHRDCKNNEPVKRIFSQLAQKVDYSCSASSRSKEERIEALSLLRAIENIGNMSEPLVESTLKCVKQKGAATSVRVAAAQAFRNTTCHRQVTTSLVEKAVDHREETEVRIASYIAAIKCAEWNDTQYIVNNITKEMNTQVRAFIMSHLWNLQESSTPYKDNLRYLLSSYNLTNDYERDIRKYSRNIDLAYYSPSLGLGAEVETNVIYSPKSWLPRQIETNLTANIFNTMINIAEFGVRLEDFEPVLEKLLGPGGYLKTSNLKNIWEDLKEFGRSKAERVSQRLHKFVKGERQSSSAYSQSYYHAGYRSESSNAKADAFARLFGQEWAFAAFEGNPSEMKADDLIETIFEYLDSSLLSLRNLDTARTVQLNLDYAVPTIQGIPLNLQMTSTAIMGLKMEGKLNIMQMLSGSGNSESSARVTPGLSVQTDAFIGYNFGAKIGLQSNNTVHTANDLSIKVQSKRGEELEAMIELPQKAELLNVKSETYLREMIPGFGDKNVKPQLSQSERIRSESCSSAIQPLTGLKACWKVSVPDIFRAQSLPLGESNVQLYLEKAEQSIQGMRLSAKWKNQPSQKKIDIAYDVPGSSNPHKAEVELELESRSSSYSVKAFTQCSLFQNRHFARSVRVDLERKSARYGRKFDVALYSGQSKSPSSGEKVLGAVVGVGRSGESAGVDFELKTYDKLRPYVEADIQVSADMEMPQRHSYLPKSLNLHKYEVSLAMMGMKFENYIRKSGASSYEALAELNRRGRNILKVRSSSEVHGTVSSNNLHLKTNAQLQVREKSYETELIASMDSSKLEAKMELKRSSDGSRHFSVSAYHAYSSSSSSSSSTRLQVELPSYDSSYLSEVHFQRMGGDRYETEAVLKRGNSVLCEIKGPMTLKWEPEEKQCQINAVIKGELLEEPCRISAEVASSPEHMKAVMDIKSSSGSLLSFEGELDQRSGEQTKLTTAFVWPNLVESKIEGFVNEETIHMSSNVLAFPKSPSSRRIKAYGDINTSSKQLKATVLWDADRSPEKKMAIDSSYDMSAERRYASVRGTVTLKEDSYHYKAEARAQSSLQQPEGSNGLLLEITEPSGKSFKAEVSTHLERPEGQGIKAQSLVAIKTFSNREYKLQSDIDVEMQNNPLAIRISKKSQLRTPSYGSSTMDVDATYGGSYEEKNSYLKAMIKSERMQQPMEMELSFQKHMSSFQANAKLSSQSGSVSHISSRGSIEFYPHGGIESLRAEMEAELPMENMRKISIQIEKTPSHEAKMLIEKNSQKVLSVHYSSPYSNAWQVIIESPSRTLESRVSVSSKSASFVLYPNKKESSKKYEVSAAYDASRTTAGRYSSAEIRYSQPEGGERMVSGSYDQQGESIKGSVLFDIFQNKGSQMKMSLESAKIAEGSYRTKAAFQGPSMRSSSEVTIESAYTHSVKGITFKYHREASSYPSVIISTVYDKRSSKDASIVVLMKTHRNNFELSGILKKTETFHCFGYSLNGTVDASSIGTYDVSSALCSPVYIEVTVREKHSNNKYIAKAGVMNPTKAELLLEKVAAKKEEKDQYYSQMYTSQSQKQMSAGISNEMPREIVSMKVTPIVKVSVQLWTPRFVSVEAAYDANEMESVMPSLRRIMKKPSSLFSNIANDVVEEVVKRNFRDHESLAPELRQLMEEVQAAMRTLSVKLEESEISYILEKAYKEVKHVLSSVRRYVEHLKHRLEEFYRYPSLTGVFDWIKRIDRCIMHCYRYIRDLIWDFISHWKSSDSVEDLLEPLDEYLDEYDLGHYLLEKIEKLKEEFPRTYHLLQDVANKIFHIMKKDILYFSHQAYHLQPVRENIESIRWNYNLEQLENKEGVTYGLLKNTMKKFFNASLSSEQGFARIQIPLAHPSHSLYSAMFNLGVPSYKGVYTTALSSYKKAKKSSFYSLFQSSNHTAILSGRAISTFDGAVIKLPPSDCTFLLASFNSTSLEVSRPGKEEAKVELQSPEGQKIEVTLSEGKVMADGRSVPHMQNRTVGDIRIVQVPEGVILISPSMTVRIAKEAKLVEIKVSSWSFGKVKGLFGINDNEKATDFMTPAGYSVEAKQNSAGPHHMTPEASRRLAEEWSTDKSCRIPHSSTEEYPKSNIGQTEQCKEFVEKYASQSSCELDPQPYIRLCYIVPEPCPIAKAYALLCKMNGYPVNPPDC